MGIPTLYLNEYHATRILAVALQYMPRSDFDKLDERERETYWSLRKSLDELKERFPSS